MAGADALNVIEREPWGLRTVLELVDPSDDVRIGSTFCWRAVNCRMRIQSIAPPHIRPSHPNNVCVLVELVDVKTRRKRRRA